VAAGDFLIDRYSDPTSPRELMHANLRTAVSAMDWPDCKRAAMVTAIPALLQAMVDIFGPTVPHDRHAVPQPPGQVSWLRPDRGTPDIQRQRRPASSPPISSPAQAADVKR
jgi:hypothetical protein